MIYASQVNDSVTLYIKHFTFTKLSAILILILDYLTSYYNLMYNQQDLEARFLLLRPKIIEAGILVKSIRDRGEMVSELKPDGSYVTNADKQANEFITDFLKKEFHGEYVLGEEYKKFESPNDHKFTWFVDPIDGTSAYVSRSNEYYILVGLCIDGIPILGIHYQPETGDMIFAFSGKAPHIIKPRSKPAAIKIRSSFWGEQPRIFIKSKDIYIRDQVKAAGVKRATYAKGMVDMISPLFGKSEGYISYRPTHFWDLAAPAAIMRAAGFKLLSGESAKLNDASLKMPFYYALPPDTPDSFIRHIETIHSQRLI
jgi:3'(2'), 5'-bisphosphate nucleotidase